MVAYAVNFARDSLRFHGKWWQVETFDVYFRDWNLWAYHIFLDGMYYPTLNVIGNRPISKMAMFMASIVLHEFALVMSLGFWTGIVALEWSVIALPFLFLAPKIRKLRNVNLNFLLLFALSFGQMLMIVIYGAEYYARENCPQTVDNWLLDKVTPRMITCYLHK